MKAILLAAGFGSRLQRDVDADTTGQYKFLDGLSKALLPLGSKVLADLWLDDLKAAGFTKVQVITNARDIGKFQDWAKDHYTGLEIDVINTMATTNDSRNGAVKDLRNGIHKLQKDGLLDDDEGLVVIGGDTLFDAEFKVKEAMTRFNGSDLLLVGYPCADNEVHKRAILETDEGQEKVLGFHEKPSPDEVSSRLASPCLYIMGPKVWGKIDQFLKAHEDKALATHDAPGTFINWRVNDEGVKAESPLDIVCYRISHRYDCGSLEDYRVMAEDFKDA
eukprot:Clim_evm24s236 gene=Clim_evmTU24s236